MILSECRYRPEMLNTAVTHSLGEWDGPVAARLPGDRREAQPHGRGGDTRAGAAFTDQAATASGDGIRGKAVRSTAARRGAHAFGREPLPSGQGDRTGIP